MAVTSFAGPLPPDLFRFTTSTARALAEEAGLSVLVAESSGGYAAVLLDVLGLPDAAWTQEQLGRGSASENATRRGMYAYSGLVAQKP